ncbi:alpha-1B-glycoprotein isoform X1 [Sorex araneus]|uniref:alpha-1B-glycoprotein isoform X1 n=1 Tax=Sorex araneus TaxID=42254 RepID=UPI002433AAC1|nr:alpha-1B-glycoprotein isoform X1 [Sorex araneus]
MKTLTLFLLLLCGLAWGPLADAAVFLETRPTLWVEPGSLQDPWAHPELLCQARLGTTAFQLYKDGVALEPVHLDIPATEKRFPLGAVTAATRGLYRCRSGLGDSWTPLSNLVEVTGPGSLPPPSLQATTVPWITEGLKPSLRCRTEFRPVTLLLTREGSDQVLQEVKAPDTGEAIFPIQQAGDYSCSYRLNASGATSPPSASVLVQELARPPPPTLTLGWEHSALRRPGEDVTLHCVAPLNGVSFQLRRGVEEKRVEMSTSSPDRVFLHLKALVPGDGGLYTCRYRLLGEQSHWSEDSAPLELQLSDESLPAPTLSVEPASPKPRRGDQVQLQCRAPRADLRFALLRQEAHGHRVLQFLSPTGAEAHFKLHDISVADSGNYTCLYMDPSSPFKGSKPSAPLELLVDGPAPKPQLHALWSGAVTAGRDAVLRCESPVPNVSYQLLRAGEKMASVEQQYDDASVNFKLSNIGPQHAGNYSCQYRSRELNAFLSEPSNPVELRVAGEVSKGSVSNLCPDCAHSVTAFAQIVPIP